MTTSKTPDRNARGRTAAGRLAALDAFLLHREAALLRRMDGQWRTAAFVDVGFGEHPWTTLDAARAFRVVNPELPVLGIEREPHRAAAAQVHANANTRFLEGGFDAVAVEAAGSRLIRVMNVLRQYREDEVPAVHQTLGATLIEGGLLVEGSADPHGDILTAHLFRRAANGLQHQGLLFHTSFEHGFAPMLFRDWLPRDLRRRTTGDTAIAAFFRRWTTAWQRRRATGGLADPRVAFEASVRELAQGGEEVELDPWCVERGYLLWSPQNLP